MEPIHFAQINKKNQTYKLLLEKYDCKILLSRFTAEVCRCIHTYIHTYIYIYIHMYRRT